MTDIVTPSPLGCYRDKGFSPIAVEGAVIEISEGVLNFPIGAANSFEEMYATFFTHPKFKKVLVSANGVIEFFNKGFDFIRVLADGLEILYAESDESNDPDNCVYVSRSIATLHTFTECKSCGHEIRIESGLGDLVCNDGVQWTVTLVLSE